MAKASVKSLDTSASVGLILIVLGISFILGQVGGFSNFIESLFIVLGVLIFAYGILDIFRYKNVLVGVIELIIGVGIVFLGWGSRLTWIIIIVLAVVLLILSLMGLFSKKKNTMYILICIGELIAGILLLLIAFGTKFSWSDTFVTIFFIVTGALLVIDGIALVAKRY